MNVSTFEYLRSTLAHHLHRQDMNMRLAIPIQMKVAVSISRLATCNSMQCIADLYKIGFFSNQLAVFQFCATMNTNLLKKFIRWPPAIVERYAHEFHKLHQISYVVGMNGSTYQS